MFSFAHVNNSYVPIADNTRERIYMLEFDGKLPEWAARWQPTVDAMLKDITLNGPQFLMVDQGFVEQGQRLRRPGPHVDGYWHPAIQAHGGGHSQSPPGRHKGGHSQHLRSAPRTELLVLTSDIPGCVGYFGEWEGKVDDSGDASAADLSKTKPELLLPHHSYVGDTSQFVHESIPQPIRGERTVVRINCHNASYH